MAPSLFSAWQDANIDHSHATRLSWIFLLACAGLVLYGTAGAVYNVFFNPLHHLPGPKLWIAFPLLRQIAAVTGRLDNKMRQFHAVYGDVVCFAPNMVSFTTAQAWKDIYGHGHGHQQLQKRRVPYPGETPHIIACSDADHSRFRKSLAHAFSEKALSQQEPLIKIHIDLLIEKLHCVAVSGQKTDMVLWYNLCTFDLIGDLAFGESFDGLSHTHLHEWVSLFLKSMKATNFMTTLREYPLLFEVFRHLMPAKQLEARQKHQAYTRETVMRRVNKTSLNGRGDFMDAMQRHKGEADGLTDAELISNSLVLIVAGSETTATLLSGVTYLLLRNPDCLAKATTEVRSAFSTESDINFINASSRLPYILACLDEAMRLYPPVPTGVQRITPADAPATIISDCPIPPKTYVAVHHLAAYYSPQNFSKSTTFIPDRWISDNNPFPDDKHAVLRPFSYGPRNCVGRNLAYNEMRLILARVLWNFDLELCPKSDGWMKQKSFILWDKPSLMCVLRKRQDGEKA